MTEGTITRSELQEAVEEALLLRPLDDDRSEALRAYVATAPHVIRGGWGVEGELCPVGVLFGRPSADYPKDLRMWAFTFDDVTRKYRDADGRLVKKLVVTDD